MLDLNEVRAHPKEIQKAAKLKGVEADVDAILDLDKRHRTLQREFEEIRATKHKQGANVAQLAGEQKKKALVELKNIDTKEAALKPKLAEIEQKLATALSTLPNPPLPEVPRGKDESDNVVIKTWSEPKKFDIPPLDHVEIGQRLNLLDIERAGKTSGSRFAFLKNEAVQLEFALIQFAMNLLIAEGFIPMVVPVMVKRPVMYAGGYLERGGVAEIYHLEKDDLYLIGTSEQAMVGYYMDETIEENLLPRRFAAFSTCFRREAGSYGKDVRGILRVHQFDKVEMFCFTKGDLDHSKKEHAYFVSLQERIVQELGLPYRVVQMCTGDLGVPAANKIDLECWMPGQNRYRETHSASNTTDFQARRANTRYRSGGETKFVHTVNGTAVAIGRMLIAILENYQQKDGSVDIPPVLQPYLGGKTTIEK